MNRKSTAFTYFYTALRTLHACMVIHDERFPPETIKHVRKAWKTLLDSGKVKTQDNATYIASGPKEND